MQRPPPRRRPARSIGDAPLDGLIARREDLAKGWLVALVEQAPLDRAQSIVSAASEFAREAPHVCEALLRALGDDADLRRIEAGGALEPLVSRAGKLAGARDAEAAVRAVDALLAVCWSALRAELGDADAAPIGDAAERVALVGELVRGAALRGLRDGFETAPPVWIASLDEEVVRSGRAGTPLSVLLVELEDGDRVAAAESRDDARGVFGRFARAVRDAIRAQDVLACETDARVWVIAPDTARSGAVALGSRIVAAVRSVESWRGAPLTIHPGIAVLGEDGDDGAALIEAAEVAKFAAQASGIEIETLPKDPTPPGPDPHVVS